MRDTLEVAEPEWAEELGRMLAVSKKAELEGLMDTAAGPAGFCGLLVEWLVRLGVLQLARGAAGLGGGGGEGALAEGEGLQEGSGEL